MHEKNRLNHEEFPGDIPFTLDDYPTYRSNEKKKLTGRAKTAIFIGISALIIIALLFARVTFGSGSELKENPGPHGNQNPITVLQYFEAENVKVGLTFKSKLIIRNHSSKKFFVRRIDFSYDSDQISVSKVKVGGKHYKHFEIMPGEQGIVSIVFKAVKTGKSLPPVARVTYWGNFIGGKRTPNEDRYFYFQPQNPIPRIKVSPVRLPGIPYRLTVQFEKVPGFYNLFALKVIGIALLIFAIFYGFENAIYSEMVDSPLGRLGLAFLMAFAVTGFLPFVYKGILWVWRTSLPPLTHLILLLVVSTIITIRLRLHLIKNVILDSLVPGSLLSILSYLIYVGFKAYQHNGFMGLSIINVLAMWAVIGIAANAYFLRKYGR